MGDAHGDRHSIILWLQASLGLEPFFCCEVRSHRDKRKVALPPGSLEVETRLHTPHAALQITMNVPICPHSSCYFTAVPSFSALGWRQQFSWAHQSSDGQLPVSLINNNPRTRKGCLLQHQCAVGTDWEPESGTYDNSRIMKSQFWML